MSGPDQAWPRDPSAVPVFGIANWKGTAKSFLEGRIDIWGYDEGWPRYFDDETYLRHMALALHQMGGPIWSLHDVYDVPRWRMGCSDIVAPSDALDDAIWRWFDDYMEWTTGDFVNPRMNPRFPFDEFNRRGEELAGRWRAELGAGWVVEHHPAEPFASL